MVISPGGPFAEAHRILFIDAMLKDVGHHTQNRYAGALLQEIQPGLKEADITPEFVDDKAFDPLLSWGSNSSSVPIRLAKPRRDRCQPPAQGLRPAQRSSY